MLLAEVALLSQSRGSLYATAVMLVLVFAFLPGRTRTFATLVPVAIGIGAAAPAVLHATERLEAGARAGGSLHNAIAGFLLASVVVGLVVAVGAAIEQRRAPGLSPETVGKVRKAVGACAVATLVVVLAGGVVASGDPAARIRHAWDTFKGGYAANAHTGSRLVSGLGSERYDFYRVALDEFLAHPVLGIGVDNFAEQYLRHGRSTETPHYPHSVELRTLTQTGLIGTLLAVVGLGAACWRPGEPFVGRIGSAASWRRRRWRGSGIG